MKAKATREGYGDVLLELGREKEEFYVVDCDISKSMKSLDFSLEFPDQHINVGIAEQNAAGVAAGIATTGIPAIISTYAVFGSMRMLEQVRTSACYPELNVKICCSHAGLTPGNDGVTHQAIEDMGIYRTIPNMKIVMPADYYSAKKLIREALKTPGPVYVRMTRDALPHHYDENEEFEIGKAKVRTEGTDVTIVAIGDMLHQALSAAEILKEKGVNAEVIDLHTLKPLDNETLIKSINKTKCVITAEDHSTVNGLGSAVSDLIVDNRLNVPQTKIGLKDSFAESGNYYDLLAKYKMDDVAIADSALEIIKTK